MDNPQGTLPVSETEKAWLAGIIDGEGSIILSFQVHGHKLWNALPEVHVGNTEQVMIETIADIYQRLNVGRHITRRKTSTVNGVTGERGNAYKDIYVVAVVGFLRVRKLLPQILPYMVTSKRQKGEMILRYVEQRCERIYPEGEGRGSRQGRKAAYSLADVRMMHAIALLGKTKHLPVLEGLLRDLERDERSSPRMFDDIVRPATERGGGPTRDGPAVEQDGQ